MLNDFFRLDGPITTFDSYKQLEDHFRRADDLKNVIYTPEMLPQDGAVRSRGLSFRNKRFVNVSLSKKTIRQVTFKSCTFVDCLFIGTAFEDCEFHDCHFINCNPYKCSFMRTYVDPIAFAKMLNRKDHSNIGVGFYSRLRLNFAEMHQKDHEATADFEFRRWRRYQLEYERREKKISNWMFVRRWLPDVAYYVVAGYGYRGTFFAVWTAMLIVLLMVLNRAFGGDFVADVPKSPDGIGSYVYSLYQTLATFTTLGSNAVALNARGMCLLGFESLLGVIWLSIFTGIVVKKVVR